jgi:hypothetical protein
MPANWVQFVNSFRQKLMPGAVSSPKELADALHDAYFAALQTTMLLPSGAPYIGPTSSSTLQQAFEDSFEKLKNFSLTFDQIKNLGLPPAQPGASSNPDTSKEFKEFMRSAGAMTLTGTDVSFTYYELENPQSKYVLAEISDIPEPATNANGIDVKATLDIMSPEQKDMLYSITTQRGTGVYDYASIEKYYGEVTAFGALKAAWTVLKIAELKNNIPSVTSLGNDPFDDMANALIQFWSTEALTAYAQAPASFPATIPAPGTYAPLIPGFASMVAQWMRQSYYVGLSDDIQKPLQMINQKTSNEKIKQIVEGVQIAATTAMAVGFAATFALHLLQVKMLYSGQMPPAIPVQGIVLAVV